MWRLHKREDTTATGNSSPFSTKQTRWRQVTLVHEIDVNSLNESDLSPSYDSGTMRRREFMTMLAAFPVVSAALVPEQLRGQGAQEIADLVFSSPDTAATTMLEFFSDEQFAALSRVSDLLMPPMNGRPGALDARVPEFLDFLIGVSPEDRQRVYREGVDGLNGSARSQFGRPYAVIADPQAESMLAPLREPWTYRPPEDPVARFLVTAKMDVRTATQNSLEWDQAAQAESGNGRRGQYWLPID
jgi:hypothetical protein